ncbi:hypothetical protein J7I94_37590 [Streptomyces sp. ISL-12]|uniref:hypothetical protein n=1 Tax=Streptomyces sp. ISL-12 TaxID=2819177 RepID=UPI001BE5596C|nr:hypothetical protein [Streptomyces sp. ISL-12]MBT2416170.1 hypothetical protein [Streptomyces sp. ISL-12]
MLANLHEVQRDLIQAEHHSVAQHQERISSITTLFASLHHFVAGTTDGVRYFEAPAEANGVIARHMDTMSSHIYTAHPDQRRPVDLVAAAAREIKKLQQGIRMRTIYPESARTRAPEREWVRKVSDHGAEVRTMAPNFVRMILIDNKCAIISDQILGQPKRSSGYIITHPGLVGICTTFYRFLWDRADPWFGERERHHSNTVTTSRGREILRKMEGGQTIDQIARLMGLSRGTINKEIKTLYEVTNTSSHFALGAWWGTSDERKLP